MAQEKYKKLSEFEFIIKMIGSILGVLYISIMPINNLWIIPSKLIVSLIIISFMIDLEKNSMILKGELSSK